MKTAQNGGAGSRFDWCGRDEPRGKDPYSRAP